MPPPPSTQPPSPLSPLSPEEEYSDDDSFQELLKKLKDKHKGQPPLQEVQAALLRSFERARQESNNSTAVHNIEDADLEDGDWEDADLKDGDCEDANLEEGNCKDADLEDGDCEDADLEDG
jgi:hypothetical protein